MKKIYIAGNNDHYANWILPLGFTITYTVEEADLVMFTGGSDVTPMYYGHNKEPYTSINTERDIEEFDIFSQASALNKKCIGICRGAQFLCVAAGGKLIQDMHHPSVHTIKVINNDKEINVTSSHHQMMYPFNLPDSDYLTIGYTEPMSGIYNFNGDFTKKIPYDSEIIYFNKIDALGIQSHPEWQFERNNIVDDNSIKYFQNLLTDFLNNENIFSQKNVEATKAVSFSNKITV
tara:strand:+ start:6175 stop:6876 length:702 start_codon:yes stop_codon:yes gene_type:complete